ncbi:MAG TPA: glycine--tRNA ligase subunit beta [Candidatus Polarisedimenticolaceae bacterium]
MKAALLVEIGCEEIPARMIPAAANDLAARVVGILDQAGLAHGAATAWGGTRRLAVRVAEVEAAQAAREELVLGPPAAAAFAADGAPTPAGAGFAKKQGIDPAALERIETDKGVYAGFRRTRGGSGVGEVLAGALPGAVASMSFPKTMRWGEGAHRWVRPAHWVVALHGEAVLPMQVLGVASGRTSNGHRFLASGAPVLADAFAYEGALRDAHVVVDPVERRRVLRERLEREAEAAGGSLVADPELLDEVGDLVEWPGVVLGRFDADFLALPREILVTTLRHHQKAFSVARDGRLVNAFLSVANTDRDPAGHVRRGNEWVVSGRLEDARFFWGEDRKRPLASRVDDLAKVVFHRKVGSYRDKAEAVAAAAAALAARLGLDAARAAEAARLSKADLVTGLVGEFPELQGVVGGLLLEAEGADAAVARAVYEHYRPAGAEDAVPESDLGAVVSVADKLHTIGALLAAGETPSGSRDPFGLRRAANGVFRVILERGWPLGLDDLGAAPFLRERLEGFLRERGATPNEIAAVLLAGAGASREPLPSIAERLDAIGAIRGREDFARLVDLVKRVANIRKKNAEQVAAADSGSRAAESPETDADAAALAAHLARAAAAIEEASSRRDWRAVVDLTAGFVSPVDRFFEKVLVVNPDDPSATHRRLRLLGTLESLLTRHFDVRELPGQAERRG